MGSWLEANEKCIKLGDIPKNAKFSVFLKPVISMLGALYCQKTLISYMAVTVSVLGPLLKCVIDISAT